MTNYSQRYSTADNQTAGAFAFDTISSVDYAISKLAFGALGAITYVDASNPLPVTAVITGTVTVGTHAVTQSGTWNIGTLTGITNVVHVDDNSGSLTVDGTVAATQSGTWTVQPGNTANTTAWLVTGTGGTFPATQSGAWNIGTVTTLTGITNVVHIDDNSGSITVDGTVAATQSGTWNITNVSGTISLPTGASTAANQTTVQTPIAPATATATKGTLLGVQYNSTQATFTDGQQGSLQVSSRGAALVATGADTFNVTVNAALPAGSNAIGKLSANSGVTIGAVEIASAQTLATVTTVTTVSTVTNVATIGTSVTPGTSAAHLGKAEDAAHTTGDTGVMLLAVRQSSATDLSAGSTNGDYEPLQVDANGRLHVIASSGIAGDVASAAADSGNPLKIGGVGKTANPTAVTDGQRVNALFDKLGKQVVVGSIRDLKGVQQTQISSSTSETTIVTQVASTFLDLYGLIITNTSATGTKVTIKDSTSGTTRAVIYVPPTETRGFTLHESAAIPQATVNTNWTATCGTSVAAIEITALYVKNT